MAEKKKKSKFKRILKGLKKAAILGGTAWGASKLFGGRRPTGGFLKSGAAGGASLREPAKPLHLGEGVPGYYKDDILRGGTGMTADKTDRPWWKFKHGGRVTGAAKRGFGRALMKGKK